MAEPLKVGDVGIVRSSQKYASDWDGEVVKTGRRWAHVRNVKHGPQARLYRFDMFDGSEDAQGFSSTATFYTPERLEEAERVIYANKVIRGYGLEFSFSGGHRWLNGDRIVLAQWLEATYPNGLR